MLKKKSIAFIGPIEPFRSGVAKHSTQIALELSKRDDVVLQVYSFKRLYPKVLFPGDDDRDKHLQPPEQLDAKFWIDTLNPLTWKKVISSIKKSNVDTVIVPAWTFFVAPCLGWISRALKRSGIHVIAIVHNAFDHEAGNVKNALMKYQLLNSTSFVCHNQSLADDIKQVVEAPCISVSPHPIFDQYPQAKGELRRRANVELLFFGIIRDYKGLDILLEALTQMPADLNYHLSIVGECWGDINQYKKQVQEFGLSENVEFVDRYVSDQEAAEYFHRADAVVLPYRSMTGTGVIPLAYHYKKPVIATNLPAFHEVIEQAKTGVIASGVSVSSVAESLIEFASKYKAEDMEKHIVAYRKLFSWHTFIESILSLRKS
ncbi:MAG: glycosyltransferase [Alteromonadaceae bacterium TMED7]|nr:MAG: glycosyltransferase [Alteromonadaceae bacterium TMED7]|tara:strand:- start:30027 stop:31148 length:1122 start_codon:yes stop_codon:yes gene_type:complete